MAEVGPTYVECRTVRFKLKIKVYRSKGCPARWTEPLLRDCRSELRRHILRRNTHFHDLEFDSQVTLVAIFFEPADAEQALPAVRRFVADYVADG